jgi:hypothetical protein
MSHSTIATPHAPQPVFRRGQEHFRNAPPPAGRLHANVMDDAKRFLAPVRQFSVHAADARRNKPAEAALLLRHGQEKAVRPEHNV